MSNYGPMVNWNSSSGVSISKLNANTDKYPEEDYGPMGSRERRKKTQKCMQLRNTYGITFKCYQNMAEAQDHRCAICHGLETNTHWRSGDTMGLSVDHNHSTGAVRALLCSKCNKGLGTFGDDIELLEKALTYLKAHSGG